MYYLQKGISIKTWRLEGVIDEKSRVRNRIPNNFQELKSD
jgi:hypothetical protein